VLAAIKFVVAIGFFAYLIDFARALVVGREPNRETLDGVLALAAGAIMLWAWPALAAGEGGLIRAHATEFLLLSGAMIVLLIERQLEERARPAVTASTPLERAPRSSLFAAKLAAPTS
jgi:hypothetical protein